MKPVRSDDARRRFRELLDDVEHKGEHVTIMRYQHPAVVIVPITWYEQIIEELADAHEGGRKERLAAEAEARESR